jgi:diguanylate cyclase (GGDEF)-like protein/PAS domain S-box-containing protein
MTTSHMWHYTVMCLLAAWCGLATVRHSRVLARNRDLTARLEATVEERTIALRYSEQRLLSLITNVSDVVAIITPEGFVRYASPSVRAVLGYEPDEVIEANLFDLVHPDDASVLAAFLEEDSGRAARRLDLRIRHHDGGWRRTEAIGTDMCHEPALGGFVFTARDVTERRQLEDQLTHQAFHDALTGLANRALLSDRLSHAIARSGRTGRDVAVLFVDLDEFKVVNDSFGHAVGDELLRTLADRLAACIRPGDTLARLGGDEFAILMEDSDDHAATALADRLLEAIGEPLELGDRSVDLTASIGIATSAGDLPTAGELLRNADVAMYRAKWAGKARHTLFRREMHDVVLERTNLHAELREALQRGEFDVYYQPIIEFATDRVVGFEALARWWHPARGLLAPDQFVGLSEETGLIVPLGQWVLHTAVNQLAEWDQIATSSPPLTMSVNVSMRQFRDPDFVGAVRAILEEAGVDPDRITLELTETVLDDNDTTVERLQAVKALGVHLALDDFGTGFSSLSYLRRFPFDQLKIDKSFVDELETHQGVQMVRTMIEMADVLMLETVAEGIEHPAQALAVRLNGCRLGQGFLYSRPLSRHAAAQLLVERVSSSAS